MKKFIKKLLIILVSASSVRGDCNVCHKTNKEACHSETEYSLCIDGEPHGDIIECPTYYVCTSGPYVCYPRNEAEPSCVRKENLCGVCSANKVFACINETTIAFCYGEDKPVEGVEVSYCLDDTVCDINSEDGFCTESHLTQPSCSTNGDMDGSNVIEPSSPIASPSTTTTFPATNTIENTTGEEATIIVETTDTLTTTAEHTTTKPTTAAANTSTTSRSRSIAPRKPTTTTERTTTIAETSTTPVEPTSLVTETTKITKRTTTTVATTTPTVTTSITTAEPTTTTDFKTTTKEIRTTATLSTTTSATPVTGPRDANTICKDAATTGSFYADDETCTSFIVCYIAGGHLAGLKKMCKPGQYFPPGATYCSSEKPDVCT